jgi:tetratricopeptide (TPR) repeat protein
VRRFIVPLACIVAVAFGDPAGAVPQEAGAGAEAAVRTVAPARQGLDALALPDTSSLEQAVAEQIAAAVRALELGRGDRPNVTDLARRYGELGQVMHAYDFFDSAEAAYRNATRLSSSDVRWRYLLGYLFQQTGRFEEAAEAFERVGQLDPARREAAIRLADTYLQLNRLREARERFDEVLEIFPALARKGLGELALREQRFAEAADHFRAVLERAPSATSVHYSLAMAYRGLGQLDRAREHLQRRGGGTLRVGDPLVDGLQALVRGERALVMQGRRAYDAGQFQEAADAFSRAARAAPQSAVPRLNLGLTLARLGKIAEAASHLEAAVRLEPANVEAGAALAMVLLDQGREADALDHLRLAFEQRPADLTVRAGLLRALLRLGRVDEAIAILGRVRAQETDDEDTLVSLSILLADRQRFQDALTLLEQANRRFPDRMATATTFARLLASSPDRTLRDGARALTLAQGVYAAEPSAVHAETVALALAELERCTEALDWMRRAVEAAHGDEAARLQQELPRYVGTSCRR